MSILPPAQLMHRKNYMNSCRLADRPTGGDRLWAPISWALVTGCPILQAPQPFQGHKPPFLQLGFLLFDLFFRLRLKLRNSLHTVVRICENELTAPSDKFDGAGLLETLTSG